MERAELMQRLVDEFNRLGIAYERDYYDCSVVIFTVSNGDKRTYITFYSPVIDITSYWYGTRMASVSIYYESIERIFFDDGNRRLFVNLVDGRNYATVDL